MLRQIQKRSERSLFSYLKWLSFVFVLVPAAGTGIAMANNEAETPIIVSHSFASDTLQEGILVEIVREQLLLNTEKPYAQANVHAACDSAGNPENLVVELLFRDKYLSETLSRDIYLSETVRIALKEDYSLMNEDVPVILIPTGEIHCLNEKKVIDIVRKQLLLPSENPYREAKVAVFYNDANEPVYLFVYLMRKDIYSFETFKIFLGGNYHVISVEREPEPHEAGQR